MTSCCLQDKIQTPQQMNLFLHFASTYISRSICNHSPHSFFKYVRLFKQVVSSHMLRFSLGWSFFIFMPSQVIIRMQTNSRYHVCETSLNYPSKISEYDSKSSSCHWAQYFCNIFWRHFQYFWIYQSFKVRSLQLQEFPSKTQITLEELIY